MGIGDWGADNGLWEAGVPTAGPGSVHSGNNCVGTVLNGNYTNHANTRLISPPFTVHAASQNPRLRFWHWFSIENGDDQGRAQISTDGGTSWTTLQGEYEGGWSGGMEALTTARKKICFRVEPEKCAHRMRLSGFFWSHA